MTSLKIGISFSISCSHIDLNQDLNFLGLMKSTDSILRALKETGGNYEELRQSLLYREAVES